MESRMTEGSIGDVVTFPDKETGKCRFRLMRDGKIIAEVTYENAVGPDGKAHFEMIVQAYDYFRRSRRDALSRAERDT